MLEPVATINGRPVYSDKRVSAVINTKVVFDDGSYADVQTGDVVNLGKGYITIGKPPMSAGAEDEKVLNKAFIGTTVEVIDVSANVSIQPYTGNEIRITAKGTESALEDLTISEDHGTVLISGKGNGGNVISMNGSVVIGGQRRGVSINSHSGRGGVVISGPTTLIQIDIQVPERTAIKICGVQGKVNIGNVNGSLRAKVSGVGEMIAGSMTKVSAEVSGAGTITILSVKGDVSLNIQGSGNIHINGGQINNLGVKISGTGDINVNATAEEADFDVSGVGNIYVSQVVKRPYKRVSGFGSIRVGNW